MVPKNITLFICLLLVAGSSLLHAQLFDEGRYEGLRCGVAGIRNVQIQGSSIQFTCDLANTGRETLHFVAGKERSVLFTFDGSLESEGLAPYREVLAAHILRSGLKLPVGAYLQDRRFTLDTAASPVAETPPAPAVPSLPPGASSNEFFYPQGDGVPCADLIIDTIFVHKDKSYRLDITLRIRNQGTAPARLYQPGGKEEAMGVTFFLGNAPVITRSSLFIQGEFVKKVLDATGGVLGPGEQVDWPVTIRPEQRPAHLKKLQCQLDNFQFVIECDRTNNSFVLDL